MVCMDFKHAHSWYHSSLTKFLHHMLILALSNHYEKFKKKTFGSGVHKVNERHLHLKPEGQEYHNKRTEAWVITG